MGNIYYNGKPIEDVNFEEEFEKESKHLMEQYQNIMNKQANAPAGKFNYEYWTMKLAQANKNLEVGKITLS